MKVKQNYFDHESYRLLNKIVTNFTKQLTKSGKFQLSPILNKWRKLSKDSTNNKLQHIYADFKRVAKRDLDNKAENSVLSDLEFNTKIAETEKIFFDDAIEYLSTRYGARIQKHLEWHITELDSKSERIIL